MTDRNLRVLDKCLLASAEHIKADLDKALVVNAQEQDLILAYFCMIERLAAAETTLLSVLCEENRSRKRFVFQAVNTISPDYLHYESMLASISIDRTLRNTNTRNGDAVISTLPSVELAALYRLLPNLGNPSLLLSCKRSGTETRIPYDDRRGGTVKGYTVVSASEFRDIYMRTPNAWQSTSRRPNRLFCGDAGWFTHCMVLQRIYVYVYKYCDSYVMKIVCRANLHFERRSGR
jgi:hypothetical protein